MPKGIYNHKPENYPPSRKGSKLTEAHKQRIREFMTGNTPGNKGKKMSAESSKMKSVNNAKYWLGKKRVMTDEWKKNIGDGNRGKKTSQETKTKISKSNKAVAKYGKEHHGWVENKKRPLYKAVRTLFKYRDWRTAIFTRDNFTCTECSATKCYVEADHYPIRFVDILKKNEIKTIDEALNCSELWNAEGRTLCKPCHLKTLSWGKSRLYKRTK